MIVFKQKVLKIEGIFKAQNLDADWIKESIRAWWWFHNSNSKKMLLQQKTGLVM